MKHRRFIRRRVRTGKGNYAYWHVWALPIALGFISAIGLLAALIGDGVWDGLSWFCLTVPLVVIGRFVIKPNHRVRAELLKGRPEHK